MSQAQPSETPSDPSTLHAGAAAYWADRLDPHNIEREAGAQRSPAADAAFARTPDFQAALAWLMRGAGSGADSTSITHGPFIDLGAGLGAHTFAMALAGCRVIAVDTSPARLRALRARARELGVADRVECVVAAAERLPFAAESLPGIYTKSVLIHTDMPRAAAELARVLRSGGRAALTEPQPRNPFAMAYRRWLAPREWQGITRYVADEERAIFARPFLTAGGTAGVRYFYVLGFLAFVFQFALPCRLLLRGALAVLGWVDGVLMCVVPGLRKEAWFSVSLLQKAGGAARDAGAS